MKGHENIVYRNGSKNKKHLLDIFHPNENNAYPVLIFVHGGSWYNGCKEWYNKLGHHLADKKVVSVIINYRLGEETDYTGMAEDLVHAVKWVWENIEAYFGDKDNIFIGGHSAGGHLSALVSLNNRFFNSVGIANPLKGCILVDAFGLNMDYVMHNNTSYYVKEMQRVFTKDPEKWKDAAPVRFIHPLAMPFLILTGSRTYPYLTMDNEIFRMNLEEQKVPYQFKVIQGRNHMQMITDLQDPKDPVYEVILQFMHNNLQLKEGAVYSKV